MRQFITIFLFLLIVGLAVFALTIFLDPSKTYDFFASLSGSETLDRRKLESFVPAKAKFKVSFPAKRPGELVEADSFLRQTPLPCPQYYVADRDVGYFATECFIDLPRIEYGNGPQGVQLKPESTTNNPLSFAAAQTGATASTTVENSASTPAYNLDPMAIQSLLDSKCEALVSKSKGTISNKVPASLSGGAFPGRWVDGTFKNTNNAFRMRMFLDQRTRRIVCISVVGKTKRVYSPQANKFLDSLYMWSM